MTTAPPPANAARASVVLIHGAWHRAACWDKVVAGLAARGTHATAVELPLTGVDADVAAARAAIVAAGDDAIVVAHSYGGAVVSAAASGIPTVKHLVYLCAFMLAENEDVATVTAGHPMRLFEHLQVSEHGTAVDPAAAGAIFYGDCAPEDVAVAIGQLRPMASTPIDTSGRRAWRDIPSTYVLCTADEAVPPSLQRHMATHATRVVEWPTSHSPFLSQPHRIVELVASLVAM